jgi:hypothetical protein
MTWFQNFLHKITQNNNNSKNKKKKHILRKDKTRDKKGKLNISKAET